jgi:hypothetical protein
MAYVILWSAISSTRCRGLHEIFCLHLRGVCNIPPSLWSSPPANNAKRTNNGTESFHSHYNGQFYARHPNISFFLDVIRNIQSTTYVKLRSLDTQALVRRSEADKVKFSTDQFEKYITGTVSRASYACSMGYKFAARTDL